MGRRPLSGQRSIPSFLPWALVSLLLFSATPAQSNENLLQDRLRAHIEFLASDELRGRQPGTPGYDIAARYVASHFEQFGLIPAGAEDSYFQQVPLRKAVQEPGSATMVLKRDGDSRAFEFVEEFYTGPSTAHAASGIEAGMVFAGYGIEAPELGYNDFEHLDVQGKIVVTLGGQPLNFPSEEGAHFGSSREKARAITAHGGIGWVTVYTPRNQRRYSWDRVRSLVGMPSMGWLNDEGEAETSFPQLEAGARIHYEPAQALFEGSPHGLASLLEADETGEGLPVFPMSGTLSMSQRSRHEDIQSPNVAGVLPGSDPVLSSEYLVYLAHLDHIGELHGEGEGDMINNGALDNASGISVMLETARLFAQRNPPRRSVLFLAVTAEEKGLVGSEYFAIHPTVPKDAIVAAINLDMPVLLYDFADVIAFGAEHSSLGGAVKQAAAAFDTDLTPDPFPEQNIFVRSDHYRFVQQGVPSIFLVTGIRDRNSEIDAQPLYEGFLHEHYHRPSDDLSLPINYSAAERFTRINERIGEILANDSKRPEWVEGDFFGTTFER